jgi:hypothetical protein
MIGVFIGFSRIFLLGVLFFKGRSARRLYKSFGVKGLTYEPAENVPCLQMEAEAMYGNKLTCALVHS